jgi:hypothetical protein
VRFLIRQDPCKNPLKYKEVLPQISVSSQGKKWLAKEPQHSTSRTTEDLPTLEAEGLIVGTTSYLLSGIKKETHKWQKCQSNLKKDLPST